MNIQKAIGERKEGVNMSFVTRIRERGEEGPGTEGQTIGQQRDDPEKNENTNNQLSINEAPSLCSVTF